MSTSPSSGIFGTFEKLTSEWGLNAIAGWLLFSSCVGAILVALVIDFPYLFGYNYPWHLTIAASPLIVVCVMVGMHIVALGIAAFTPSVHAAVRNSMGMSEKKPGSRKTMKERFLNVEAGVVGALVALSLAMFLLWGFGTVPTGIYMSYWSSYPDTTTYLENVTFAGVNSLANPRGGYAFNFGIFYINMVAAIGLVLSMMASFYYATHTSPLMFMNAMRNVAATNNVYGAPA